MIFVNCVKLVIYFFLFDEVNEMSFEIILECGELYVKI